MDTLSSKETVIDPGNAAFGTLGSDIIVPKGNNVFSSANSPSFLTILQKDEKGEISDKIASQKPAPKKDEDIPEDKDNISNTVIDSILNSTPSDPAKPVPSLSQMLAGEVTDSADEPIDETDTTSAGRPKGDKSALVSYLKTKIESKEFLPYEDYDEKIPLEEYLMSLTDKERNNLIDHNWKAREEATREDLRKEVFESLPGSLQYAAAAVERGATEHDLQNIYAALLRVEQTRQLSVTDENDQEAIAHTYLQATNFGDQKEIAEQVSEWKENGQLEKKVKQFKPKLDQMQEQQVQLHLQQVEDNKRQQEEIAQYFSGNLYEALKPGDLNGLKLDKKMQNEFYNRLTKVSPSQLSGKPVNSLGAALERIQFSEQPDYALLVHLDWLANDPEGYWSALKQLGKNEGNIETEKKLKMAQQTKDTTSNYQEPAQKSLGKKGLPKVQNVFK